MARRSCAKHRWFVVALVLLATVLTGCAGTGSPAHAPHLAAGSTLGGPLPQPLASLPFTDENGRTVHLSDFRGRTVVLQDTLTLCQEHCPIDTATFVGTARAAAADPSLADTVFLSITVDPVRDTPAQLSAYRRLYAGAARNLPHWHLLTGSPHDVALLWKDLHVYVHRVPQDAVVRNWRTGARLTYDVDHGDEVFFLDRRLRERYVLVGQPSVNGTAIPRAMRRFLSKQGRTNERHGEWSTEDALSVLRWLHG